TLEARDNFSGPLLVVPPTISYFIEEESIARQRDAHGNTPTMFAGKLMQSENPRLSSLTLGLQTESMCKKVEFNAKPNFYAILRRPHHVLVPRLCWGREPFERSAGRTES